MWRKITCKYFKFGKIAVKVWEFGVPDFQNFKPIWKYLTIDYKQGK